METRDMRGEATFRKRVEQIVRAIPQGETLSYGEVARRAGSPHAARAVGSVLSRNADVSVPCHRVIRSDGSLAGYNGLRGDKKSLLVAEGVCA